MRMLHKAEEILPQVLPLKKLIGPSFILLGMGLGSGEIILWPYLSSNWGLGIAWGALLGILFQFFINMEIERYALLRGESVFVGLGRRWKWVPYWLILSTLIGFGWPGIIASSAFLFASVFGGNSTIIAIGLLICIGIILASGKYIYNTVEKFSEIIILFGVPSIFVLTFFMAKAPDWGALAQGLIGKGLGYLFLPVGIPLMSFLAAFAFSGAGGNLNLAQSGYVREKGYGMGFFSTKIKGLFSNKNQVVDLNGYEFNPSPENVSRFKGWWKAVNVEHFFVFFLTGLCAMLFLLVLSYATTYGLSGNASGIHFVINEARIIGEQTIPFIGSLFAVVLGIMLFSTQFSVMDACSRIMSENYAVIRGAHKKKVNLSQMYYLFLLAQIVFGIAVFTLGFNQPLTLLVLGAVINAVCMFVHIGLVNWLNNKELPKEVKPSAFRIVMISIAFVFFGVFSVITIYDAFLKLI